MTFDLLSAQSLGILGSEPGNLDFIMSGYVTESHFSPARAKSREKLKHYGEL